MFQLERASGAALLLLQGAHDELVDARAAALMALRLRDADHRDFEVHIYPRTGHLIEPPHLPVCPVNYHGVFSEYGCAHPSMYILLCVIAFARSFSAELQTRHPKYRWNCTEPRGLKWASWFATRCVAFCSHVKFLWDINEV